MQFTTTMTLLLTSLAAIPTSAGRIPRRDDNLAIDGFHARALEIFKHVSKRATCNTTPSATTGTAAPVATVSAATAADCQAQCDSNAQCQSFAFGTIDSAGTTTQCLLYSVDASQIPSNSGDLKAYDKTCTGVSDVAPSTTSGGSSGSDTGSNTGSGSGSDNSGSSNTGASTGGGNTGSSTGAGAGGQPGRRFTSRIASVVSRDICGSVHAGNSNNSNNNDNVNAMQTLNNVNSAQDCLNQGKSTSGCKS